MIERMAEVRTAAAEMSLAIRAVSDTLGLAKSTIFSKTVFKSSKAITR